MKDNDNEKPLGRNSNYVYENIRELDTQQFIHFHLLAASADALERIADHLEQKFKEELK